MVNQGDFGHRVTISYFWQERGHQVANLTSCFILRPSRYAMRCHYRLNSSSSCPVKAPVDYVFLLEKRFG